ncbi:MAG: (Fe-S)-binding protein [Anaerolineae bacterium]|nr:(Fe-S)-binding protein [Anaerolineae bacterium]
MLSQPEQLVFVVLSVFSLYLTWINFSRVYRVIQRGGGRLHLAGLAGRIWRALEVTITQRTVLSARPVSSLFHVAIVWGFLFYFIVNVGDVLEGFIPGYHFLDEGPASDLYRLLADLFSIGVLVGMTYFLVRRFLTPAPALRITSRVLLADRAREGGIRRDSAIVGAFILFHVGGRFAGQSFALAASGADPWQPFASAIASLWAGLSPNVLTLAEHGLWWLALGLILTFLPWFPQTKHFHLMVAPFNFFTKPERRSLGAMDPLDLEDETVEMFGAANLEHLSQTQIVDAYACIMCNRCQDVCPAYHAGTELSPAALEINKRYYLKDHAEALAQGGESPDTLFDYALTVNGTWACTTCAACVEICPVGNEPMFDILNMRQYLVLMEGQPPDLLAGALVQAERAGDPWGNPRGTRLNWAQGLGVPVMADKGHASVLYWVGCAGAYDPAGQRVSQAMVKILRAAGVDFAVLGDEERCNCEWARRSGQEALYQEATLALIETFNQYEFNLIITQCPHCFNTFANEYPDFGGEYEVWHHSQYIAKLIAEGRITPEKNIRSGQHGRRRQTITYHDSCFLGRYNGEYDSPRHALASVPGVTLVEMPRHRNRGLCCGGGGAQVWMDTHQEMPVNLTRFDEGVATGADAIGAACPFCSIMLNSAAQTRGNEDVPVRDIAEIIAERL